MNRHSGRRDIKDRLVLLDSDRIEQDRQAGRDALSVASKEKLKLIFLGIIYKSDKESTFTLKSFSAFVSNDIFIKEYGR